jgi:hypothetical protein
MAVASRPSGGKAQRTRGAARRGTAKSGGRSPGYALVVLEFLLAVLHEVLAPLFQLFLRAGLKGLQEMNGSFS